MPPSRHFNGIDRNSTFISSPTHLLRISCVQFKMVINSIMIIITNLIYQCQHGYNRSQPRGRKGFRRGAADGFERMLGVGLVILLSLRCVFPSLPLIHHPLLLFCPTVEMGGRNLKLMTTSRMLMGRDRKHRYVSAK